MSKRILPAVLAALLVNFICYAPVAVAAAKAKEVESAAKVKAAVFEIGVGSGTPVTVKLRDGTKLKGSISDADEEGFVIVVSETGSATRLSYTQVTQVKRLKNRGEKLGRYAGYFALFGLITVLYISYARKDGCGSCAPTR
jgi:hypothetical protein